MYHIPNISLKVVKETFFITDNNRIDQPVTAAKIVREIIGDADREIFAILLLNSKMKIIAYHEVSKGTLSASLVHPREVFKTAILLNAASIITIHNHPSGEATPSEEDLKIWKILEDSGNLLGIKVMDNLILGERFYSTQNGKEENY